MNQLPSSQEKKEILTAHIPVRIGEMLDAFSLDIGYSKSETLAIILDYFFSNIKGWKGGKRKWESPKF